MNTVGPTAKMNIINTEASAKFRLLAYFIPLATPEIAVTTNRAVMIKMTHTVTVLVGLMPNTYEIPAAISRPASPNDVRSEERRVGKEGRPRGTTEHERRAGTKDTTN